MTAVKVHAAVRGALVNASGQGKSENVSDGSFSSIMDMQNKATQVNSTETVKTFNSEENAIKQNFDKADNTSDSKLKKSTDKTETAKNTTKTDNKVKETEKAEEVVETEDVVVNVENALQSFLVDLQNLLGLSEEGLNQLIQDSNLTATDLLDPVNLQNLILNNFGADNVTDALVNEPLANALQQGIQALTDVTNQLSQATGIPAEELTKETIQSLIEEGKVVTDNKEALHEKPQEPVAKDVKLTQTATVKEQEVKVVIEKDTSTDSKETNSGNLGRQDERSNVTRQTEAKTDFVEYFTSRVENASVDSLGQTVERVDIRTIVTQIVNQIKVSINPTQTSMQMMLNPESLGQVQLVVAHKEGVMTAHFTVENQVTKEALESSMNTLKQSFEERGLKVAEVEVSVGSYSESFTRDNEHGQAFQGQDGSKHRHHTGGLSYTDDTEETPMPERSNTNYNGTVEYTA